ncbi:hypothetical protein [Streptomyces niveus]|uniref:hypothetical protein n=1 Tax=Streptomyces niveus TaxID=193462 RepID=UPI003445F884
MTVPPTTPPSPDGLRARPSAAESAAAQNVTLVETLRIAVPLHIAELSRLKPAALQRLAVEAAGVIGSKGDVLQFVSPKKGEAAQAFNALARGLAAASLIAWGGVTFAGLHWCTVRACPGPDGEHPEPVFGGTADT